MAQATSAAYGAGFIKHGHDMMIGSRELEPLCILWVKAGFISGKWTHAFKLLRR